MRDPVRDWKLFQSCLNHISWSLLRRLGFEITKCLFFWVAWIYIRNIFRFFHNSRTSLLQRSLHNLIMYLGAVHKLRLQEEGGRWSKKLTFCKLLYHRKCKRRGEGGQKKTNLVNVVCERPLNWNFDFPQACTSKSIFLNFSYPYIFMYVWIYNGIKGLWLWIFQAVEIIKNTVSTLLLSHPPRIRPLEWCMVIWTSAKNSDFFSSLAMGTNAF